MAKGGAEAVCINTFEALPSDHEMTHLTLVDPGLAEIGRDLAISTSRFK